MITLYHSGTQRIVHPLANVGRPNLDFGQGFYLTNILEQAQRWAVRISRQRLEPGIINVYEMDWGKVTACFRYLCFKQYDKEWLDFVVDSRLGKMPWKGFDIIEGGVANDRVIDTVEGYIAGTIDEEHVLRQLAQHAPNNQICLLNQQLIDDYLSFVKTINL